MSRTFRLFYRRKNFSDLQLAVTNNRSLDDSKDGPFYKFHDKSVDEASFRKAVHGNFGRASKDDIDNLSRAYILVCACKSILDCIFTKFTKHDIPTSLLEYSK